MKHLSEIKALLKQRTGLVEETLGPEAVKRAVQHRMAARDLVGADEYWLEAQRSDAELAHLIDEIVVTETWFFRDLKPFQYLAENVARHWLFGNRRKPLRVLSAPCATGEEPYSIAMTLLDGGLAPERFTIDAVDISERSLQTARRHIYRPASFRGDDLRFRDRHFDKLATGEFRISGSVQAGVHFSQGNLIDPEFCQGRQAYEVVFCRNLLIYFDERSRKQLLDNLDRLLVEGGLLFVGHAEASPAITERFQPMNEPGTFSFCKISGRQAQADMSPADLPRSAGTMPPGSKPAHAAGRMLHSWRPGQPAITPGRAAASSSSSAAIAAKSLPRTPSAKAQKPESDLQTAQRLADEGRLAEAAALCSSYLDVNKACPKGFFLLAVIRMAEGRKREAEELFAKAVYLDPRHTEAMVHLAHLAELREDQKSAQHWRRRLGRSEGLNSKP